MLACADIIVIDYGSSRLVHAVGLGYPERTAVCFPPGSRAAQRRETPGGDRFKRKNLVW